MKQLFILDFSSGNAQSSAAEGLTEQEIEKYIQQRRDARAQKKFKEADAIRNTLLEKGVALEDFPDGRTLWRRK